MWGVLPYRIQFTPDMHRWSLASYDLCFTNKFASPLHLLLVRHSNPLQSPLNLLHLRPNPPNSSLRILRTRRPLPANHHPSHPPPLSSTILRKPHLSPLKAPRQTSSKSSTHLARPDRPFLLRFHLLPNDLHHKRRRHVPSTNCLSKPKTQLGAYISRGKSAPTPPINHEVFPVGRRKIDLGK